MIYNTIYHRWWFGGTTSGMKNVEGCGGVWLIRAIKRLESYKHPGNIGAGPVEFFLEARIPA